jgi:predicted Zn-dependent peptidase
MNSIGHYSGGWSSHAGIMITIYTGGYNEDNIDSGFTHLAEHGMFMRTQNINSQELQRRFALFFDHIEARTSGEYVQLFCYFPSKNFDIVFETLYEMMFLWTISSSDIQDYEKLLKQVTYTMFIDWLEKFPKKI